MTTCFYFWHYQTNIYLVKIRLNTAIIVYGAHMSVFNYLKSVYKTPLWQANCDFTSHLFLTNGCKRLLEGLKNRICLVLDYFFNQLCMQEWISLCQ